MHSYVSRTIERTTTIRNSPPPPFFLFKKHRTSNDGIAASRHRIGRLINTLSAHITFFAGMRILDHRISSKLRIVGIHTFLHGLECTATIASYDGSEGVDSTAHIVVTLVLRIRDAF